MTTPISLPTNFVTSEPPQTSTAIAAETQVTSADILADAHDIKQTNFKKPSSTIQDLDELRSFQLAKRRDYEQQLNKNRLNYGQWMRYARWEIDHNHDFKRARSIMERALEVNVQHVPFWVRYIELELLHKNINHARNLLDRAVTILPRTDKFWFMYVQTEETLSNYHGVRTIFERWLKWKPTEAAWDAYVSFEERYAEYDKARAVFLRYVTEFPNGSTWQRWIVFETTLPHADDAHVARIRGIFEAAMDNLLASKSARSDPAVATIIVLWVRWEASVNESERASAILAAVLDQNLLSKDQKLEVLHSSNEFKDIGTTGSSLHLKKKLKLEKSVAENTRDYDAWWEYAKLQELTLGLSYAIELLTKAVETFPLDEFKSTSWRRYVFLWVKLALYTEYSVKDILKAREVWLKCLQVIPHGKFTFAKIWTMYAEFELRNGDGISQARKILGQAIGQSCRDRPKTKLFKYYIALEKRLGELERVRKVYEKWLESCLLSDKLNGGSSSVLVLQDYIDFEKSLGESERCVALFEIGISDAFVGGSSSVSGLPDNGLFENYIEFLKEEFRYEKARQVYRNGLDTSGAQSWIRFALFESSILSPAQMDELEKADTEEVSFQVEEYHLQQTRAIFSEAYTHFKNMRDGVNATSIVEAWLEYERMHGSKDQADKVEARRPKSITKRKTVDGVEEVYQEYEFPEMAPNLSKFLAKAKQWASASATTN